MAVAPSRKPTLPVGVEPDTLAVKVTLWPWMDGLTLLVNCVSVAASADASEKKYAAPSLPLP